MTNLLISTESSLPPNVHGKTRGYLEIELAKIHFITGFESQQQQVHQQQEQFSVKNRNRYKKQQQKNCATTAATTAQPIGSHGATAKFVWWGECKETASSIRIVRAASATATTVNINNNNNNKNNNNKKFNNTNSCLQQKPQQQQKHSHEQQQPLQLLKCSKVRYSIQTCNNLFLDYLQSCEPLEISISTNVSNLPLGLAQVRLPTVFIRKFAANYTSACNFEHKSKIYTLYSNRRSHGETTNCNIKCGEFQLRFKMMFAPSAAQHLLLQQQEQLHSSPGGGIAAGGGKLKEESLAVTKFATDNSSSRNKTSKNDEIVEAMKKIDAKLVAYLAGEDMKPKDEKLALERLKCTSPISQLVGEMVQERFREQQMKVYQRVNSLKMHLEALTLQPAGTKFMELLEEDIKPIFTVECQLSHELIKNIPRYDMFHIMQFESGQFQSLTQCTRFAQDAQRDIHLQPKDVAETGKHDKDNANENEKEDESKLNFGKLSFIVWWRQPGTCLNEMLGMAIFDLEELYQASLLEQCKCLAIKRRDIHMANLYFKISMLLRRNSNGELKMLKELKENTVVKECNDGGSDEEQQSAKQSADAKEAKNIENAAAKGEKPNDKAADMKKASNNNQPQIENTQFAAETMRIRLLKGYIYVNEARNLVDASKPNEYYLVCRRFWHDDITAVALQSGITATANSGIVGQFEYHEQFSILNDEQFLQRVEKQFLQLELWRKSNADNGNSMEPFGILRLPLHQYFIAYRDAAITNHLCKGKLPVISIDGWVSVISHISGETAGELKCLLAIGSEEQIENLKITRGLPTRSVLTTCSQNEDINSEWMSTLCATTPLEHPSATAEHLKTKIAQIISQHSSPSKAAATNVEPLPPTNTSDDTSSTNLKLKKTADLLDMLQSALTTPPRPPMAVTSSSTSVVATAATSSSAAPMLSKPLQQANMKSFKFSLDIQRATNLPLNPGVKGKKGAKRNSAASANATVKQNRFPPNEAPSVYVTFQADEGYGKLFKSHEGPVYATNIVEKSTQPVWQQRFRVSATVDYLSNPQKRFILKIWKKATTDLAQCRMQPTPMDDAIVGFAALDLTVFLRGLHIAGCFNIVDFNGRINGQLELKCQPLEDVQKIMQSLSPFFAATAASAVTNDTVTTVNEAAGPVNSATASSMDNFIDQFEASLELSHLNLGQAIKRKFSELEQISQRLRTRLVDVTGEEFSTTFDINKTWDNLEAALLPDNAQYDEFDQDLKTPPQEVVEADDADEDRGGNAEKQDDNDNEDLKIKMISNEKEEENIKEKQNDDATVSPQQTITGLKQ